MLSINIWHFSLAMNYALILFPLIAALIVAGIVTHKSKIPLANALFDTFWLSLLAARLAFVAQYFEQYRDNLWSIINIRDGGFHFIFGLITAIVILAYQLFKTPALRKPAIPALLAAFIAWLILFSIARNEKTPSAPISQIEVHTLQGESKTLAEISHNKPMILNLWATWCPSCIREMPALAKAQKEHPEITFIFANQGENSEAVQKFLTKYQIDIKNIVLDENRQIAQESGSDGLPTTLFYNSKGKRVHVHVGELSAASIAKGMNYFK